MSHKINEFEQSWESSRWLIEGHLIGIDNLIRQMQGELSILGVSVKTTNELLRIKYAELCDQVAEKQSQKYDRKTG